VGSPLAGCPFPRIAKIIILKIKEVFQMKSQKKHRKLSFSKRTIADLNFKGLNGVHGGLAIIDTSRLYCETRCDQTCANTCYYSCDDITCPHVGTMCMANAEPY
jgi:hypothetical protein